MRARTFFIALAYALSFLTVARSAQAQPPNIIYILADDLGRGDLGCYGQKTLTTPNIDRLASEGMKFTRHYAGSTVCAPSRCVLMTGLHTGHCRVRGNGAGFVPDSDLTVPKVLQQAGYHTACIGKFGLGKPLPLDDPRAKGFDYFFGYVGTSHAHNFYTEALIRNGQLISLQNQTIPGSGKNAADYKDSQLMGTGIATSDGRKEWAPQLLSDDVQRYLDERAKDKAKPFFLYYALNIPHTNNEAGKDSPLGHGMEGPGYGEFASKDWPDAEKGFAQFMRFLDNEVGGILAKLKAQGLDENTIIMFSSDNGPHQEGGHKSDFFNSNGEFKGIKRDLTDGGIRVPFLVRWPGKVKAGSVSEQVSGFQDLLPTVAELSGAKAATQTDGISFAPTLLGKDSEQKQHPYLYWNFDEQGGKRAVLEWPWKLIHLNTGASRPGAAEKKNQGKPRPLEVELYNLEADPGEETNVAKDNAAKVAELEGMMRSAWQEPEA
jgi:arylsulfatase A-like enzyme